MKPRADTNGRLERGNPTGQPTNNQRRKDRFYKTIEFSMEGKTAVKDNSYPVPTWKIKKVNN